MRVVEPSTFVILDDLAKEPVEIITFPSEIWFNWVRLLRLMDLILRSVRDLSSLP